MMKGAGGVAKSASVDAGGGAGGSVPNEICHQMCVSEICQIWEAFVVCVGRFAPKTRPFFFSQAS